MFAIDLTSNNVIVAYRNGSNIDLWSFPWIAVFKEYGNFIELSVGNESVNIDEKTVVLYDLKDNFPRINDKEVQLEILIELIRRIVSILGINNIHKNEPTLVVLPYGYSSNMLEIIEESFQSNNLGLKLSSLINECVATIIYFFEIHEYTFKLRPSRSGEKFCFINAVSTPIRAFIADVKESDNERICIVQDYIIFNPEDPQPLSDLSISGLKTIIFGNTQLVEPVGTVISSLESKEKCRVMVAGAMLLGQGKLRSGRIYSIEGAFNFGIQIDSERFYSIIPKELIIKNSSIPIEQCKAFILENITHDVNLNLYCGFSDRLSSSIYLGTITLPENQFHGNRAEIIVSVKLDSMHSGSFSVAQMPQGSDPIVKPFNVPGWLG
ncbi:MAG: hypothetical protein ACUVWN_00860 [bacterium]